MTRVAPAVAIRQQHTLKQANKTCDVLPIPMALIDSTVSVASDAMNSNNGSILSS